MLKCSQKSVSRDVIGVRQAEKEGQRSIAIHGEKVMRRVFHKITRSGRDDVSVV